MERALEWGTLACLPLEYEVPNSAALAAATVFPSLSPLPLCCLENRSPTTHVELFSADQLSVLRRPEMTHDCDVRRDERHPVVFPVSVREGERSRGEKGGEGGKSVISIARQTNHQFFRPISTESPGGSISPSSVDTTLSASRDGVQPFAGTDTGQPSGDGTA